ncbi:MAG: hypothetical protein ACOYM4_09490 [Nodosilinea sp.]|jgi:hypothetical protein
MALNSALLKTLGASGLAFLITGLLLHWVIPRSEVTLLIDRSYCSEAEWQRPTAISITNISAVSCNLN